MKLIDRIKRIFKRPPDFIIGQHDNPYMLRWWLIPRNRWFNVYLHKVCRSDDDRALHDHPWASLSILLAGEYIEIRNTTWRKHSAGSVILRSAKLAHRLEIETGKPCWTLFITGRNVRVWGFHCPRGWVPWTTFVAHDDHGNVGQGCGE